MWFDGVVSFLDIMLNDLFHLGDSFLLLFRLKDFVLKGFREKHGENVAFSNLLQCGVMSR